MTVEDVFLAALEMADANSRRNYLDSACGENAAFRQDVEELLAAHSRSGPFLDVPAARQLQLDSGPESLKPSQPDERLGTVLDGKYKLTESIGEGGMGTVYLAEQLVPLSRKVAVKVVKAGMDSKAVLARFEAERQALAMMDHPNIAKVLDAGTTPGGRPFFVMELVTGAPITAFCDGRKLAPRARLELFVQVCQAIQHAHQKGIIHRDIKPSNVLVALYDDRPVPKVIDFGVAKAVVGPALTDQTLMTGFGMVVGTPEYMSPEQASLNNPDIDTRSDVFSLGVLLYELLTGATPVDRKSLDRAGYLEILRVVREVETPKPSARLSTLDNLPNVAANRGMEPAHLSKLLQGELDWVVLKSIEKDRARRYETANALGRDIQRYLANELVEARPASRGYRLKKFVRRQRGPVIVAGLVLFTLIAGVVGTAWGLFRASQANSRLVAKNAELDAERVKVQLRFDTAVKAIETFHTGVSEDALLKNPQFEELRTNLLKQATGFYSELEKLLAEQTDTQSRKTLANSYHGLGELIEKIGDMTEALAVHRKALAVRRALSEAVPGDNDCRLDVARSLQSVGTLLSLTGDTDAALRTFEELRELATGIEARAPSLAVRSILAGSHRSIGDVLAATGQRAESRAQYQAARAIYQSLTDEAPNVGRFRGELARVHVRISNLMSITGKPAEALAEYRKARNVQQQLVESDPAVPQYQSDLAKSHINIGNLLVDIGQSAEAMKQYAAALEIQHKLADRHPAVLHHQRDLATSYFSLGLLQSRTGQAAPAMASYFKALEIRRKLAAANPAIPKLQGELADTHHNLGSRLIAMGKSADALAALESAREIRRKLVQDHPAIASYKNDFASSLFGIGVILAQTGKPVEALDLHVQARDRRQQLLDDHPTVTEYRSNLASSQIGVGMLLKQVGKPDEALQAFQASRDTYRKLVAAYPNTILYQSELARSHGNIGNLLADRTKLAEALAEHAQARDIRKRLAEANPTLTQYQTDLATSNNNVGWLAANEGRFAEAFAALDASLAIGQKLVRSDPKNPKFANLLGFAHAYRGGARVRAGNPLEAGDDLRKAVEIWTAIPAPTSETRFEMARASALLAKLGGDSKSGVTKAEATAFADRGVAALAAAVKAGWAKPRELGEPDFDSLRGRAEFQKILADLAAKP